MQVEPVPPNCTVHDIPAAPPVSLSRWVNEWYPALNEILSAHDVARLTRRPYWLLFGLSLIGRFPRKTRFRGRCLGWRRSEVLAWMGKDLSLHQEPKSKPQPCKRRTTRQVCPLPTCCGTRNELQQHLFNRRNGR